MTVNANSIVQHVIQIKNGINKHDNVSVKLIVSAKNIIVGILAYVCDKIINATDSVSANVTNGILTNITNTMSTNITSIVSINSDDKKVRYKMNFYILSTVLLVII